MISNCSIDERGKATGGKAGDNNGKEWRIRSWYSYPWNVVLHHPNPEVRKTMVKLARDAANNNNIGYDQYNRLSFWNELVKVNYDAAAIKTKCETDCSAGVAAIAKATGFLLNDEKLKNINIKAYTGNLKAALKAAGFEVLTAAKYRTSDKYIYAGDVLLKEGRHTAINLDDGNCVVHSSVAIGKRPTVEQWQAAAKKDGFSIAVDGIWGKESQQTAKKAVVKRRLTYKYKNLTRLLQAYLGVEIDGKCGKNTAAAIKNYQLSMGLVADSQCGLNTWESILNV